MLAWTFNHQQAWSSSPPGIEWDRTYGGTHNDYAFSVVQTPDGGYAIAGYTNSFGPDSPDFWLVKTDEYGDPEWSKIYGGPSGEKAYCVVQTADGGYAIAGRTRSFGSGKCDIWLVKTDEFGNHLWNQTYGGPEDDIAREIIETSDGGYAMAGETSSFGHGSRDFWLVKTDILWTSRFLAGQDRCRWKHAMEQGIWRRRPANRVFRGSDTRRRIRNRWRKWSKQ